ncbi:MAG: alpha/beta hydrolase, partial [Pseudomonadota bacterium]
PEISNFIAASPPVNKYDFGFLSPCPIPGLIVQGNQDSVVPEESVLELMERLSKQKQSRVEYKTIYGGDHFFRSKLTELELALEDYMKDKSLDQGLLDDNSEAPKPRQHILLD